MDAGFTNAAQLKGMLNDFSPATSHAKLGSVVTDLINFTASGVMTKAGLVIHGAASALVKAGNAFLAMSGGTLIRKAANTDMAALAGNLANGQSGAYSFFVNSAGTLTSAFSGAKATHDAAVAAAVLPVLGDGRAMIGIVVVDDVSAGAFTGGTTALDTAGLTVTYYDMSDTPLAVAALGTR